MAQVGARIPLKNKTNQIKGQVLSQKQEVRKSGVKELQQVASKKRPLETSDKENASVQPAAKKQKVISDAVAAIIKAPTTKAPTTKKKPNITDPEGLIKHLQEVATKSQEEIANIKTKKTDNELTDLHSQLASLRNQLTIAKRSTQEDIDYKAKYEAKKAQCRELKNNLVELSVLYETLQYEDAQRQKELNKKKILDQLKSDQKRELSAVLQSNEDDDESSYEEDAYIVDYEQAEK